MRRIGLFNNPEYGGIAPAKEVGTGRDPWDSPEEGLSLQMKTDATGDSYNTPTSKHIRYHDTRYRDLRG